MKSYLIIYKLAFAEENYPNLLAYLKSATYWARPMTNAWLIKATKNSAEIRDGILSRINKGDQILIIEVPNNNWATSAISKTVTDWMKANL